MTPSIQVGGTTKQFICPIRGSATNELPPPNFFYKLYKNNNMNNILQINNIKRSIGQLMLRQGVMMIQDAISDFTDIEGDFNRFRNPLLGLPITQLDTKYYFTSWNNWQKIIATINPILQQFNWVSDRFDCDDRASLASELIAMCFEINTCRPVYCDVYRVGDGQFAFAHYANIIVDDVGNAWLWDLDEEGEYTKITSITPVINNKKYFLKSIK